MSARAITMPFGSCRHCGRPSYAADKAGPAHPCCAIAHAKAPGADCAACRTSEALNAQHEKRRPPARDRGPAAPEPVRPYDVGDCGGCRRTSVRHYSPGLCFWCDRRAEEAAA